MKDCWKGIAIAGIWIGVGMVGIGCGDSPAGAVAAVCGMWATMFVV